MFDTSGSKYYYRDHDNDTLIVRVWYEDGKRCGERWNGKEWTEASNLAWMVADDIYDNHQMSEDELENLPTAEDIRKHILG